MKKLIIIFLLMSTASICRADYELRLNDGVTLTWPAYSIEGSQYCTQKEFGKFCIQKSDVVALKEIKDETGTAPEAHRVKGSSPVEPATMKTSDRPPVSGKEVLFEFYSSHESEVQFAYLYGLKDDWRFKKMEKDGNRFYIYHPVDQEIWYEFVVPTNTWYRRDPFNQYIDNYHPYLKRGKDALVTHRNLNVKYIASEHFDYFTTGDGTNIARLEEIYRELANNKLSIFGEKIEPIHGKKIRYYGGIFPGTYAEARSATIVDYGDRVNSHEMIHALLYRYPHFGPFAEGIAQCFQEEGNRFPLTEQNCSLAAKQKVKEQGKKLWDVLSNFSANSDYHLAGSFIYFHLFVEKDTTESFVRFLKELKPDLDFNTVRELYKRRLGKDMQYYVNKWEQWVKSIDETSDVFVNWNKRKPGMTVTER